jgi:hypothetical protein
LWASFLSGEAKDAWENWRGMSDAQRNEFFDRRASAIDAMRAAAVEVAV